MYCSNCGAKLGGKAIFCYNCGVKISGNYAENEGTIDDNNTSTVPTSVASIQTENMNASEIKNIGYFGIGIVASIVVICINAFIFLVVAGANSFYYKKDFSLFVIFVLGVIVVPFLYKYLKTRNVDLLAMKFQPESSLWLILAGIAASSYVTLFFIEIVRNVYFSNYVYRIKEWEYGWPFILLFSVVLVIMNFLIKSNLKYNTLGVFSAIILELSFLAAVIISAISMKLSYSARESISKIMIFFPIISCSVIALLYSSENSKGK